MFINSAVSYRTPHQPDMSAFDEKVILQDREGFHDWVELGSLDSYFLLQMDCNTKVLRSKLLLTGGT